MAKKDHFQMLQWAIRRMEEIEEKEIPRRKEGLGIDKIRNGELNVINKELEYLERNSEHLNSLEKELLLNARRLFIRTKTGAEPELPAVEEKAEVVVDREFVREEKEKSAEELIAEKEKVREIMEKNPLISREFAEEIVRDPTAALKKAREEHNKMLKEAEEKKAEKIRKGSKYKSRGH